MDRSIFTSQSVRTPNGDQFYVAESYRINRGETIGKRLITLEFEQKIEAFQN